jgi:hypothetical protein
LLGRKSKRSPLRVRHIHVAWPFVTRRTGTLAAGAWSCKENSVIWSLKAETMRELTITLEEGLFIWKMDGMTGIQAAVLAEVMRALDHDHVLVGVNIRGSSGDEEENGQRTRGKRRRRLATTMRRATMTTPMTTTTTATMTIKTRRRRRRRTRQRQRRRWRRSGLTGRATGGGRRRAAKEKAKRSLLWQCKRHRPCKRHRLASINR